MIYGFHSWGYMYKHKHLIFIVVLYTYGPLFPICTSLSIYFNMILQDQRDVQQHAIVIHEVELSEKDLTLVSSSAPVVCMLSYFSALPFLSNVIYS